MNFSKAVGASPPLQPHLHVGLKALRERGILKASDGHRFSGSVDIDSVYKLSEPLANRWDYVIGIGLNRDPDVIAWLEVHPASSSGNPNELRKKRDWLIVTMRRDAPKLAAMGSHVFIWFVTKRVSPHAVRGRRALEQIGLMIRTKMIETVELTKNVGLFPTR